MAYKDGKVQLGIEADATGVRKGTQEAKDAVRDMARDVQASAGQASKSLGGIGDGADGAAKKVDSVTRNIAASIERATAAAKAGERGTAAFFENLASQRGANLGALQPYLDQLRQVEAAQRLAAGSLNTMGVSAAQTKNALRQLPAQFTDIFTSLSSGQAPLTVLIQQGGQIKDSFGGIGPALRGVTSAISPMALALGAGAAAAAGLALAFKAGADEADEYRKALILSGNAAGATAGQLERMAQRVGGAVGGQAQAAQVLAQLAATGQLGSAQFEKMAEAAIRLERVGGPAVQKTVAAFADLAKDPLQASIKLNESTNFLTVGLYKQIKALEEQGKSAQAAALAQDAFARESISRAKEIEQGLGDIERGWLKITDAITKAKNLILGIGRPLSAAEQLAKEEAALAGAATPRRGGNTLQADARRDAARQRIEELRLLVYQEGEAAAAAESRAAATKAVIDADKSAGKAAKEHGDGLDWLREAGKAYADVITDLQRMQSDAQSSALGYSKAQQRILEYFNSAAFKNASPEMRKQAVAEFEAARAAEQAAEARNQLKQATEDALKPQTKWLEGVDKSIEGAEKEAQALRDQISEITLGKAAREALVQLRLDDAAAQAKQNAMNAGASALGEAEYNRLLQLADQLRQVADLRRQLTAAAAQKEAADANEKAAKETADDWRNALTDAFRRSFEQGGDFGKNFAKIIGNEIKARVSAALAEALAGQVLGTLGLALAGGAGGGGSGAGGAGGLMQTGQNLYSLYNYGSKAYNWAGGLFSGGMSTGAYTSMANSQVLAAYGVEGVGATTGGVTGSAAAGSSSGLASVSTLTWAALAVMAAIQGSSDWSAGFRRDQARDTGTILGQASAATAQLLDDLGFSDRIADLISGATLTAKLFGRAAPRVEAQGVQGTFADGQFQGTSYADILEKGGWFRSDKRYTETAQLSQEVGKFLNDAAKAVYDQAADFGKVLGLPAEALKTASADIKVALTDDAEANVKALEKALSGYGDALVAGYAEAVKPLATYGETTVQTIERVAGAISGVNDVLKAIGITALQASVQGGAAAVALQELFGGVGNLQQAAGSYLQNYYTEAERAKLTTDSLSAALSGVGLSLPSTRDAFRALVEAQDLSTEAGRKAFAVLMGVADAFASVTEAGRAAADIANERAQLQDQLDQLSGNEGAIRARERAKIDSSNLDLYDQIQTLTQAQQDAAAAAKANAEAAAAAAEAERQRKAELDAQQQAAWAAGEAWKALQEAAEVAAGEALMAWQAAREGIRAERDRILGITSPQGAAGGASAFAAATAAARGGDLAAAQRLPEITRAYVDSLSEVAKSADQLRIMRLRVAASLTTTDLLLGGAKVPGFASGGYHAGGLRVVGERAPEIEATGPARYWTVEQMVQASSGGANVATVTELRALRQEQAAEAQFTRAALTAIAQHTSLSATVLDEAARGKRTVKTEAAT